MKPVLLYALAIAVLALTVPPARAETARVRAGEHADFSRIVIEGAADKGWSLQRSSKGYMFRAAKRATEYDLSGVFRYIRRDRVAGLAAENDGVLELALGCDCHASAFETPSGAVVIDISAGAAPPESPFETPDKAESAPAAKSRPSTWQPEPLTPPEADPLLPVYWSGDGPTLAHPAASTTADTPAAATHEEAPAPSSASDDPPANEIREALVGELSRAAAQGLIKFETPAEPEPPPAPAPAATEPAQPAPADETSIPLRIETSIDRDSLLPGGAAPLSAEGRICPDDTTFAVAEWGDETPPADQIASLRQGLVGEFDRPDQEQVITLARLYVHLGFGAEARAALDSFSVDETAAPWLRTVASIVDGEEYAPPALSEFTSCDGDVALWALLGSRGTPARSDISNGAVARAFSALPLHLRRSLGPTLVERLVAAGDTETAHAVRAAILRAGPDGSASIELADAELALAEGDEPAAQQDLDALASGGSADAPQALLRAIRLRLDRGEAVPPVLAENAAALAFELRHEPRGPELAGLQVLALASTGDFSTAFAEEARWRDDFPEQLRGEVLLRLFAMLAKEADDWTFVEHYYRDRDRLLGSDPDVLLRLDLADRLADSGMDNEAGTMLKGEAAATARGRVILARLALNAGQTAHALGLLAGANGPEAAKIRAEAHLRQNAPESAAPELAASGDATAAGRAAWVAGDMKGAVAVAPETLAPALQTLGLPAPSVRVPKPEGELASGRALIAEAEKARGALSQILRFGTASR